MNEDPTSCFNREAQILAHWMTTEVCARLPMDAPESASLSDLAEHFLNPDHSIIHLDDGDEIQFGWVSPSWLADSGSRDIVGPVIHYNGLVLCLELVMTRNSDSGVILNISVDLQSPRHGPLADFLLFRAVAEKALMAEKCRIHADICNFRIQR